MEKFLDLNYAATQMVEAFSQELDGFEFAAAKLKLAFFSEIKECLPAITIAAWKNSEEKEIVYVPQLGRLLLLEHKSNLQEIGDNTNRWSYRGFTAEQAEGGLVLSYEYQSCDTLEKALIALSAYLAMTAIVEDTNFWRFVSTFSNADILMRPGVAANELNWYLELSRKGPRIYGAFISVATGHTKGMDLDSSMVRYACPARYPNAEPSLKLGYSMWFFNGDTFRRLADDSLYMTIPEALEAYAIKVGRKDKPEIMPATMSDDLVYIFPQNPTKNLPWLLNAKTGMFFEYSIHLARALRYPVVGEEINSVKLTEQQGWLDVKAQKV